MVAHRLLHLLNLHPRFAHMHPRLKNLHEHHNPKKHNHALVPKHHHHVTHHSHHKATHEEKSGEGIHHHKSRRPRPLKFLL